MTDTTSSSTALEEVHPECPSLYQYGSLEDKPRTIRLLKIDHDCGNGSIFNRQPHRDCDECNHSCCKAFNARMPVLSLQEACLDDSPRYEAISYAWGSAVLDKQVACDSKVLRVTQSCYDLLCRLRKRDSSLCNSRRSDWKACSLQARHYWIDAVCINQGFQEDHVQRESSQRERSHQVAMMATIYEKALEVTVWPGHVEDGISLDYIFNNGLHHCVITQDIPRLRPLIQQPYFTRIWPLQEIALSQRCNILIGTDNILDIRSVFLMRHPERPISCNRDNPELTPIRLEYERVTTLHRRLLEVFESRFNDSNTDTGLSIPPLISEVLLHARSHQASESRDKVFALYGILQRLKASLEPPDYLRPVEDIYLEASASAICKDRSLRVFEGLTGVSKYNLPSWSPDWSDHNHIFKVAEWNDHKASGSSEPHFSIQGRHFLAHGLRIDVACYEHMAFASTSFLVEADTLAESLTEPLRNSSNVIERQYLDLLEKLFLDIWGDLHTRHTREYPHWIWVKNDAENRTDKKAVCRLIGYRNQNETTKGAIKHCSILHASMCRILDRKKLFQTREGRLGIASEAVKSGDSIVLLQGCNLPMVVRPEGTKWKLIAPAYLPADGIMDGKLWRSDGPFESFTFT